MKLWRPPMLSTEEWEIYKNELSKLRTWIAKNGHTGYISKYHFDRLLEIEREVGFMNSTKMVKELKKEGRWPDWQ